MCKLQDEAMARAGEMPVTGRRMDDHAAPAQPLQWPAPDAEGLWQDAGFLDLLGGYAIARAAGGMPVFDALGALKDYTIRYFAGEPPCAPAPPEFRVLENLSGAAVRGECTAPPPGWYCTRTAGHVGPCAARRAAAPAVPATGSTGDDAQFRILTRAWREAAPLPSGALAWADLVAHVDKRTGIAANAGRSEGLQEAQQACRSQGDETSGPYRDGCIACADVLGDLRTSTVEGAAPADQAASVAVSTWQERIAGDKDYSERTAMLDEIAALRAAPQQSLAPAAAPDNWSALLVNVDLADQRARFESFAWPKRLNFRKHADQQYVEVDTADAWKGWIASVVAAEGQVSAAAPVAWMSEKNLAALAGKGMAYATGFDVGTSIPLFRASEGQAQTSAAVEEAPIECWSADQEDFNAQSIGELFDRNEELKPGDTVWVGEAVKPEPSQLIDADDIISTMGERAHDIAGEHADDYPDVSKDAEQKLNDLLAGWIRKYAHPTFWTVANIKPYVLSHDDFPNDLTPVQCDVPGAAQSADKPTGEKS